MVTTQSNVYICGKKIAVAKEPILTQKQVEEAKDFVKIFFSADDDKNE